MPLEIERKFLVKSDFKHFSVKQEIIKQGYLSSAPERSVRVRLKGEKAFPGGLYLLILPDNKYIETTGNDLLDFTEVNPFGEYGNVTGEF